MKERSWRKNVGDKILCEIYCRFKVCLGKIINGKFHFVYLGGIDKIRAY